MEEDMEIEEENGSVLAEENEMDTALANRIHESLVLDGLLIVTEDWRVFRKSTSDVNIPKQPHIRQVSQRDYKGVKRIFGKTAVRIPFSGFSSSDSTLKCSLIITHDCKDVQMDYGRIKQAFGLAVDEAIEKLPDGRKSKTDKRGSMPCHSFLDIVLGARCGFCKRDGFLQVQNQDLGLFSDYMLQAMSRELQDIEYSCCYIIGQLGQSWEWRSCQYFLNGFEPRYAEEVLVHIARDFWLEEKCLLWKIAEVNGEGFRGVKDLFFNVMTQGHASFNFDQTTLRTFWDIADTETEYASLKLYIDQFKEVHRYDQNFRRPSVQDALTNVRELDRGRPKDRSIFYVNPENILPSLKSLRALRRDMGDKRYNVARIEAILRNVSDLEDLPDETTLWQYMEEKFQEKFGRAQDQMKWLKICSHREMLEQIDNTLMVAINTLEAILEKTIEARKELRLLESIPHSDEIMTALACEAIISFAVYGKINQFPRGIRFTKELIDFLELNINKYKNINPNESPFQWLRNLEAKGAIEIVQFENGLKQLRYLGPMFISQKLWHYFGDEIDEEDQTVLDRIIKDYYRFQRGDTEPCEGYVVAQFEFIVEILWKAIVSYSRTSILRNQNGLNRDPNEILETVKNRMNIVTCESAQKFVEKLFSEPANFHQYGLSLYLRELKRVLDPEKLLILKQRMAEYFECEIYRSISLSLLYNPSFNKRSFYFILPCIGNERENYLRSEANISLANRKKTLIEYFAYALRDSVAPDVPNAIINNALKELCRLGVNGATEGVRHGFHSDPLLKFKTEVRFSYYVKKFDSE